MYLVSDLNIRDASITVSSERNTNHAAKRVRMSSYDNFPCAWIAASDDQMPWVQFDMEQDVTVWGVVLKIQCDYPYTSPRVISLKVVRSDDGVQWKDASDVISANYSVYNSSTSWLDEATTARYWKIEVLTWHIKLPIKADFIGQPKGKKLCSFFGFFF